MALTVDMNYFISRLESSKNFWLSFYPDIPTPEKKYKLNSYQLIDSITGELLILDMTNVETGEIITFSIPDIIDVQENDYANQSQEKFYFECINRKVEREYNEFVKQRELLGIIDKEKEHNLFEASRMTYRIILLHD